MGITYLWAIVLGTGMAFFPESPRFDYRHGKVEKAKNTLAKIYGIPINHRVLCIEFDEIKQKHEEEMRSGQVTWVQMFRAPTMAKRIAVGVALQALQQLTGANYFFYYVSFEYILCLSRESKAKSNSPLGNNDFQGSWYPQQLRHADDFGRRQFWNNIPGSLFD
jgi:hypothetical protein